MSSAPSPPHCFSPFTACLISILLCHPFASLSLPSPLGKAKMCEKWLLQQQTNNASESHFVICFIQERNPAKLVYRNHVAIFSSSVLHNPTNIGLQS